MEVLNLIDEMEDIIENSSQIPFSGKSYWKLLKK